MLKAISPQGKNGFIAHECIIDIRPINTNCGVSADDIAKRLMDFGFHAPTMSFPVPGTLMIEPTESESLAEIDKFCDAMIAIKQEINKIADGSYEYEQSMLRNAPHTAEHVISSYWDLPYTREEAVYPLISAKDEKYWPPVGRIDGAYGDKNLVCSCPSIEEFQD